MKIAGKAWKFGNDVDTDAIIPARYLNTFKPEELAQHLMEDIDPDFAGKVGDGDIIVAGKNFGCGSSREHAPVAIKGAGISCVIAESFARIFYRNAINIGLPIIESAEAAQGIQPGDRVEVDLTRGLVRNVSRGEDYPVTPYPEFMQRIMDAGGLIAYVAREVGRNANRGLAPR